MISDDIFEFVWIDFIQFLALSVESFKGFDKGLRHALVCLLGAADNGKALGLGHALVTVFMVQANTDQLSGCFIWLIACVLFEAVHFNLIKVCCCRIVGFGAHATNVAEGTVLFECDFI